MKKNEIFPWDLEIGCAMDYVDGSFLLVVKDDEWNDDQLEACKDPFQAEVCETNGLILFLLEGGPLDTCDFSFNIQECDQKDELMAQDCLTIQALLIDKDNKICAVKSRTLNQKDSALLKSLLQKQLDTPFADGEFDVNLQGLMDTYEPAELNKFAKLTFAMH